jgi:hypothetical protein
LITNTWPTARGPAAIVVVVVAPVEVGLATGDGFDVVGVEDFDDDEHALNPTRQHANTTAASFLMSRA